MKCNSTKLITVSASRHSYKCIWWCHGWRQFKCHKQHLSPVCCTWRLLWMKACHRLMLIMWELAFSCCNAAILCQITFHSTEHAVPQNVW